MRLTTKLARSAALSALVTLAPALALAGPTEDAKVLFNVGAQAYEKGEFAAAVQAFEQAYRLSPRPGILFSIAQAHRKEFYSAGKRPDQLRAAIAAYKEYLGKAEQGSRRSDAAEALAELEALALKMDVGAAPMAAVQPAPIATRIMVTSQTSDATISLDGEAPREVPLVADVKPGKHSVRVSAPGFFDEMREVDVAGGSVLPLDVPLREKPAKLSILARDGAQVSIDGRIVANTPLSQPLEVAPGHHLVTVTKNGYRAFSEEIDLNRSEERSLTAGSDATTQRTVSYVLFGVGAAGIVAGGVLAGLAFSRQRSAQKFDDARTAGTLSCTTAAACQTLFDGYNRDLSARDELRRDAGIVLGAGVLIGAVGTVLFAFDQPNAGLAARRDDKPKPAAPVRERPMEMSFAPIVGPSLYGASLAGRF